MATATRQTGMAHESTTIPQSRKEESVRSEYPSSVRGKTSFREGTQIELTEDSVRAINQLVNVILESDFICLSMAYYFDRADVGLYGVADFFRNCSVVVYKKAKLLMDYVTVRGGRIVFDDIKRPERNEWGSPVQAFETLLNVKASIYKATERLCQMAETTNDASLSDFCEEYVLRPLALWIRRVRVLIANTERAGPHLGVYQLNKHLSYNMQIFFETDKEITEFLEPF